MNRQTWQFIAVTGREKIEKLSAAISSATGRQNYDMYRPDHDVFGIAALGCPA